MGTTAIWMTPASEVKPFSANASSRSCEQHLESDRPFTEITWTGISRQPHSRIHKASARMSGS